MTPEDRNNLREAILMLLGSAASVGLPLTTLRQRLKSAGYDLTETELEVQLGYLAGKELVERTVLPLSHAAARYSLTAAGRDYAESQNLI